MHTQAKGLSPSQGQENATTYRTVAPGTLAQQQKPVVPQGEEGREYTIAYYKRDTRRGVDWNYQDAEGTRAGCCARVRGVHASNWSQGARGCVCVYIYRVYITDR